VFPPVPLMTSGYHFVEQPFNESDLTSRYTSLMEDLIDRFAVGQNKVSVSSSASTGPSSDAAADAAMAGLDFSKPFFLHLGYENPHVPLFLSVDYEGASRRGFFGDSVQEMDLSIGKIYAALERGNLLEDTLIVFTSDNGAWVNPSNGLNSGRPVKGMGPYDGGSNAPFFEGKGSTWEGGFRVPLLVSLPGTIPPGKVVRAPVTGMDLFPTFLDLSGRALPQGVELDGVSLAELLVSTEPVADPHACVYLWREHALYAIRCGPHKAHFVTRSGFNFSDPGTVHDPPLLFNVEWDPAEAIPLNTSLPEYAAIAKQLTAAADAHVQSITPYPSVYLAQNLSRVPCCPRGGRVEQTGGETEGMRELMEGPWRDCICPRIGL
jgi:arylsulfatase A-like enzyme